MEMTLGRRFINADMPMQFRSAKPKLYIVNLVRGLVRVYIFPNLFRNTDDRHSLFDRVKRKPACSAADVRYSLEISDIDPDQKRSTACTVPQPICVGSFFSYETMQVFS